MSEWIDDKIATDIQEIRLKDPIKLLNVATKKNILRFRARNLEKSFTDGYEKKNNNFLLKWLYCDFGGTHPAATFIKYKKTLGILWKSSG